MADYKFLGEVEDFNINDYIGLIGWIGNKPQKVYASKGFQSFYLHDEENNRLFEFEATLTSFKGEGQYEKVVKSYLSYYQHNCTIR